MVAVPPDSTLVALATDDSCDPFTICDEMAARGWYVQPQMSYAGQPATVHLSVSAATLAHGRRVPGGAVRSPWRPRSPPVRSRSTRASAAYIESLDPATLTDADFDGLLAASGLVGASATGDLALPDRMAEVNAMLDLASPRCARRCWWPSSTACPARCAGRRARPAPL